MYLEKFIRVNQCNVSEILSDPKNVSLSQSMYLENVSIYLREKILLILRQHLFARNVLLAVPNYYVFMQETQAVERHFPRNSGCGNFKL